MNPAHNPSPLDRLERIEGIIQLHEKAVAAVAAKMRRATEQGPEPRVGEPEHYEGNPESCDSFVVNCSLLFSLQPRTFATEAAKVAYTITHLSGRAWLWGTAEWERQSEACSTFSAFAAELHKVFGQGNSRSSAGRRLLALRQGERSYLVGVPEQYHDLAEVFSKPRATSLPLHRPYDCAIDLLPGTATPKGRLYSLSHGCIDYRGLNEITMKNRYPLPLVASAFEMLKGATVFTKLDLRNAYHLVRIREGDEWKTAFNTPAGHYEYLVMPSGLTNAPAVFQALVNDVLRDMLDRFVFVYLDDILIFSKGHKDHVQHVWAVLQRLLDNQLFVKAEKCQFHAPSVSFLGFIIVPGSIQMDPGKVSAVTNWPRPESRKQLQRFLGGGTATILVSFTGLIFQLSDMQHFKHGVTPGQFSSNMSDSDKDKEVRGEMDKEMTLSDDTIVARVT
eukprot:XP_011606793.1 PREDICTED: uncharacterized protein LOC105417071 [Takifugu rubripes]